MTHLIVEGKSLNLSITPKRPLLRAAFLINKVTGQKQSTLYVSCKFLKVKTCSPLT
jgi:hypothetical protein